MLAQANLAAERCETLDLDFFFIDAEENQYVQSYWKTSPFRFVSALEYMNFGDSLGIKAPALSSYRFPEYHRTFPWNEFMDHKSMDYTAPQVYWMGSHNPAYQLKETIEQYAAIREMDMVPIGAAFKEGGWTTTPEDIAEFTQAVQDEGLTGWGFWVLDQAMWRDDWLAAMDHDYIPPEPPPDPDPEPVDPVIIEITGLAGDETLRLRNAIWGEVVAKTWNGCQFPVMSKALDSLNREWYQLGVGIWVAGWYTKPVEAPEPDPEPDPEETESLLVQVKENLKCPLGIAVHHDDAGKPTIEHPPLGDRIIYRYPEKFKVYKKYKYSQVDDPNTPVIFAAGNVKHYVAIDGYAGKVSFVRKDQVIKVA